MRPSRRLTSAVAAAVMALGALLAGPAASASSARTSPLPAEPAPAARVVTALGDEITFTGHGYGHGRGMGQYGALGYAVDHGWGYRQILGHFYGGTTVGSVAPSTVSVELEKHTGAQELRAIGRNLVVNGTPYANATADGRSVRVTPSGAGFLIQIGATCAVPGQQTWTTVGTATTVTIQTSPNGSPDGYVRVCEAAGERGYRGYLTVQRHATNAALQTVFNQVTLEDYLRGVVPRESPDSWGNAGGGRGMEALKAQAVAARSYAVASGPRPSGARMCDTVSCQVYLGATWQPWGPTRTVLDGPNANTAIAATANEVRVRVGTSGPPVRTEFSSSTGGYTVPGAFPAVVDEGDDTASNPYHLWTATYTSAQVAAKLGLNGLRSITVTGRNGLGDWGGRVTQVVVVDGAGASHTYTGGQFRSTMGTSTFRSDWFTVSWLSRSTAEALVKALYADLLGRGPDPTGLAGWSDALLQGVPQATLVDTLTRSDEYIALRIRKAYVEVLGREPDPAGAQGWLVAIRNRQATVDDVQRRFYDSAEFFTASGGTNEGYVARLYTTILRRGASPSEIQTWAGLIGQRGRGWVVDQIWFSMEAARIRAGDYYMTFLGRSPDPDGLTGWAQVLLVHGEGAVRNGIAGSMEYRQRAVTRFP